MSSWADEAREEREFFDTLSIAELHALLHSRQFGKTDAIWYSIAERSTLRVSAWPLLEILDRRSIHRSIRRHAASVLLRMADSHDYEWNADVLSDDSATDFDAHVREFRLSVMDKIRRDS
jgi:hypothetical protein